MRPNHGLPLQRWVRKRPTMQLPLELETNILLRLPIKAVVRFQCVCKRWRDEIKSSYFMYTHRISKALRGNSSSSSGNNNNNDSLILILRHLGSTRILSADFRSSKDGLKFARNPLPCRNFFSTNKGFFVGCCNGLFLFNEPKYKKENKYNPREVISVRFLIYNPATGHTKTLHHIAPCRMQMVSVGFGYDCTSYDYKILCLYGRYNHPNNADNYLYSLRTDSWKIIETRPPIELSYFYFKMTFSSNNTMIWLAYPIRSIICFDLGTEEYHVVRLPEEPEPHGLCYSLWELVDLRGCSHLVRYDVTRHKKGHMMHIWVMKGYGSTRSWAKLADKITLKHEKVKTSCESSQAMVFPDPVVPPLPCAYSEDGHELLISTRNSTVPTFTCLRLQSGELKRVEISGHLPRGSLDQHGYLVMPWSGSLVQM